MKLHVLTDRAEIEIAQSMLETAIHRAWKQTEERQVYFRPSGIKAAVVHNGRHWFHGRTIAPKGSNERYWNAFGEYEPQGSLSIVVEVNVPKSSVNAAIAGFYAKDRESGSTFLMHSGRIGGGRKGINQSAFLDWYPGKLSRAYSPEGDREAIAVAETTAKFCADDISRFIGDVATFKKNAAASL